MSDFNMRSNRCAVCALRIILGAFTSACSSGGDNASTDTVASAAIVPTREFPDTTEGRLAFLAAKTHLRIEWTA